jgi:hypothetical protein
MHEMRLVRHACPLIAVHGARDRAGDRDRGQSLGGRFPRTSTEISVEKGAEIDTLSANDCPLMVKTAAIGDDIVKAKPELKPLWNQLCAAVERTR